MAVSPLEDLEAAAHFHFVNNGVLVWKWSPQEEFGWRVVLFVVPAKLFETVRQKVSHYNVTSVSFCFCFVCLTKNIFTFTETCHTCQQTSKQPSILCSMPAVNHPFHCLIVPCVGPLHPSKFGCKYLLTLICEVIHYPTAYSLLLLQASLWWKHFNFCVWKSQDHTIWPRLQFFVLISEHWI